MLPASIILPPVRATEIFSSFGSFYQIRSTVQSMLPNSLLLSSLGASLFISRIFFFPTSKFSDSLNLDPNNLNTFQVSKLRNWENDGESGISDEGIIHGAIDCRGRDRNRETAPAEAAADGRSARDN